MPELPEVETIRQSLDERICGRSISRIDVLHPGVLLNPDLLPLTDWQILAIRRRGKYLLFDLQRAGTAAEQANAAPSSEPAKQDKPDAADAQPEQIVMIIHLRMTGKLILLDSAAEIEPIRKHAHVLFRLDSGQILAFHDVRRFGRVQLFPAGGETRDRGLAELGPEPLSDGFTAEYLIACCRRCPRSAVKGVLLNQKLIAGLGNIYADESLFRAGIRPQSKAGRISRTRLIGLHQAIRDVLSEAIGHRGTSFRDYVDGLGRKGFFQLQLAVYQRTGQPCRRCAETILRTTVAGRSTHYCPQCQKR